MQLLKTRDYVKKALEEIIDAPTATGMDMSSDSVRGCVSVPVCSPGAVEVVDKYIEREKRKNNLISTTSLNPQEIQLNNVQNRILKQLQI